MSRGPAFARLLGMQTISRPRSLDSRTPASHTIDGKYLVDGPCRQAGDVVLLDGQRVPVGPRVTIALLRPDRAGSRIVVDRFLGAGEAAMRVRGAHALRVLDEGLIDDVVPYLVLERAEGPNLDELVEARGRLPVPIAVDWLLQGIEAIAQAHSYGLVHGDLSLAKMSLTRGHDETPCVKVNFGLRKVTEPRPVPGEPGDAGPLDVQPDIQALRAMLAVLLTGRPWTGNDNGHARLPPPLEAAIRYPSDTERRPRYASVADLARALAPFGTRAARASCERVECLLEDHVVDLTRRLPHRPGPSDPARDALDGPGRGPPSFTTPASGRVVFLGLAILALLGAGALSLMYVAVH
jgi:serine/threonine protein kinase